MNKLLGLMLIVPSISFGLDKSGFRTCVIGEQKNIASLTGLDVVKGDKTGAIMLAHALDVGNYAGMWAEFIEDAKSCKDLTKMIQELHREESLGSEVYLHSTKQQWEETDSESASLHLAMRDSAAKLGLGGVAQTVEYKHSMTTVLLFNLGLIWTLGDESAADGGGTNPELVVKAQEALKEAYGSLNVDFKTVTADDFEAAQLADFKKVAADTAKKYLK